MTNSHTTPAIEQLMAAHKETTQGEWTSDGDAPAFIGILGFQTRSPFRLIATVGESDHADTDANAKFIVLAHTLLPTVAAEMERLQKVSKSCPNCAGKIGDSGHCDECIQRDNANEARINELESSLSQLLDRAAAAEARATTSVDMLLFCPACGEQHVDQAFPDVCETCGVMKRKCCCGEFTAWLNPPHKSHRCNFCNHVWRPADVPTNGVLEIKTKGERDGSAIPASLTHSESARQAAEEKLPYYRLCLDLIESVAKMLDEAGVDGKDDCGIDERVSMLIAERDELREAK